MSPLLSPPWRMRGRQGIARAALLAGLLRGPGAPGAEVDDRTAPSPETSLHLGSAAREDAQALLGALEWNAAGKTPLRIGFARTLAEPLVLRLRGGATGEALLRTGFTSVSRDADGLTARARIRVDGAWATRLHVDLTTAPPGTLLRVRDATGVLVHEVDAAALAAATGGWLPPTRGEETVLEAVLPGAERALAVGLAVDRVTELFDPAAPAVLIAGDSGFEVPACLVDAMCVTDPVLSSARDSAALYIVASGPDAFVCSGGLIRSSATPDGVFFATAAHCVDATTDLGSILFVWDFHSETCNGPPPLSIFGPCPTCPGGRFPTSRGATLLATNTGVDFTLLALGGPWSVVRRPDGTRRPALAPTDAARTPGSVLHRFSHPFALPLKYSSQSFLSYTRGCGNPGNQNFTSRELTGHVEPGSSGSVCFADDLTMSGTVFGLCLNPGEDSPCRGPETYVVLDGNPFRATPATFAPWLTGCAYALSDETVEFEEAGGNRALQLDAKSGCAWTALSEASWTTAAPASGDGGATLTLTALANVTGRSRVGTLRAGFHLVRVAQYGSDCLAAVTPATPPPFGPEGGVAVLLVTAPSGCAWQVGSLPEWLTVTPAGGRGDGTLTVTVSRNESRAFRAHALDLLHAREGTSGALLHALVPVNQVRSRRTPLDAP